MMESKAVAGLVEVSRGLRQGQESGLAVRLTETRQREGTFVGIQALRAFAALVVVYGHSLNLLQRHDAAVPAGLDRLPGATGVDLFFVISGFVMTISAEGLLRKEHPVRVFVWRRVMRVVPLYWTLTAAKLFAMAWWPALYPQRGPSPWNILSSFLFLPSVNAGGEIRPVISVGWTLNFEAFFYVGFAVSLLWQRRFARVLLALTGVVGAIGLLRTPVWPVWTAQANPILFEFMAGVAIALLVKERRMPGRVAGWVLLGAGGLGLALISPALASTAARPLVWGVPAAMVVLGCTALEPVWKGRLPRWLLLLGSASYSIYLVQTFVLPALGLVLDRAPWVRTIPHYQVLGMALSVSLTTAMGVATHLLLEQPITEFLKRRFGTERIAPIARSA